MALIEMEPGFATKVKCVFACLVLSMSIASCGLSTREVISTFPSPDGKVEAIWCRNGGGGIVGDITYTLLIAPAGKEPNWDDVLLMADDLDSLQINWGFGRVLEISYEQARIHHFTNFWQSRDVENFAYVVELRLNPLNAQHSLSPEDRWLDKDSTSLR